MSRVDAIDKASGRSTYVADVVVDNMAHVAFVRSSQPHARIVAIDAAAAAKLTGVLGVFTAADVATGVYGRAVEDSPLLARDKVRFAGERVAAVVAESREVAEKAAALVEVDYDPLPAATSIGDALAAGAPLVHEAPWSYAGAVVKPEDGPNLMYRSSNGSMADVEAALSSSAHRVDATYRTQGVHQGYLEPQACVADYRPDGSVTIWLTNKAPYRLRSMLHNCPGIDATKVDVQPITLGGDFGGKGSPGDAPIVTELSRLVGRPVKSVLRYSEDLTATNPRHPSEVRVRIGCDDEGRLTAASIEARMNGGAYAGFTPNGSGPRGVIDAPPYRVPVFATEILRVYTNCVPRGNMRAPGAPQGVFAFESALDELAVEAGIAPDELRRRNVLVTGETDALNRKWLEHRGVETLDAALAAFRRRDVRPGWLHGVGYSLYSRGTTTHAMTSLRLIPEENDCVCVEVPFIETGTGSHTVMRELVAEQLGFSSDRVRVVGVATSRLPRDQGAGGSRLTASLSVAVDSAAKAWQNRLQDEPVVVEIDEEIGPEVGSYVVQIAQVAVDPETGQVELLELLTAVDVAAIINPMAHQMQIDGGAVMGIGYALHEDLDESEGQVWAANLGDFKLCSTRDAPVLRTVKVSGGVGVGNSNVKSIGESTTPPVAAAVANAVFAATACRIRELPITAERVWTALRAER